MASKLQVTPTKLQVTPTKLQVAPTKLQVTLTKLQVTRSKLTSLTAETNKFQDEKSDLYSHWHPVRKCKCRECNTFAIVRIHVQM